MGHLVLLQVRQLRFNGMDCNAPFEGMREERSAVHDTERQGMNDYTSVRLYYTSKYTRVLEQPMKTMQSHAMLLLVYSIPVIKAVAPDSRVLTFSGPYLPRTYSECTSGHSVSRCARCN